MKTAFGRILYKILVILMIIVNLSFFSISSVSEAAKKTQLDQNGNYYSGVQEANLKVTKSFWDFILNILAEIADYYIGMCTLGIRGAFVGYVALMEILLTAILGALDTNAIADYFSNAISGIDTYSQVVVNVEKIIFNKVGILNANIFSTDSALGFSNKELGLGNQAGDKENILTIIKDSVAKWYYILRLIIIAFMLILLIFSGVKMAISNIASEKAIYKQMLVDWVVGMILVFSIHYIMITILEINDKMVATLEPLSKESSGDLLEEYEYGDDKKIKTTSENETTLYETARTRAYSVKMTEGFTGAIMYAVLVYFSWKFALIYFKRMINVIILTLMAPVVAGSYSVNKIMTGKGKSQIFSTWLSEYILNVAIQLVHIIIYISFVSIAIKMSLASLAGFILTFVLMNFMTKSEKLLRKLFKLSGGGEGSLGADMADRTSFKQLKDDAKGLQHAMIGGVATKAALKGTIGAAKGLAGEGASRVAASVAAKVQSNEKYKAKQEEKYEEEKRDLEEYLKNNEEVRELNIAMARNQAKLEELGTSEEDLAKKKELEADIAKCQERIDEIGQEYLYDKDVSVFGQFKKNLWNAMKDLTEEETDEDGIGTGRFKVKEYKTWRKGVKDADKNKGIRKVLFRTDPVWRKRTHSRGLTFRNNLKLNKLLGINKKQSDILKSEMKLMSNRLLSVLSAPAGIVIDPRFGMALMAKGAAADFEVRKRKRFAKLKLRRGGGNYKFSAFGGKTLNELNRIERQIILEAEKLDALEAKAKRGQKKNFKKVLNSNDEYERSLERRRVKNEKSFSQTTESYENDLKEKIEEENTKNLLLNEKTRRSNTVKVGNGSCMKIVTNKGLDAFKDRIRDTYSNNSPKLGVKLNNKKAEVATQLLSENQNLLLGNSIIEYCKQNGITDINDLNLSDEDKGKIVNSLMGEVKEQVADVDLNKFKFNEAAMNSIISEMIENGTEINKVLNNEESEFDFEGNTSEFMKDLNKTVESVNKEDLIVDEINKNQDMLIREAIITVCQRKGIMDIQNLNLNEKETQEINKDLLGIIQEEGVIGNVDIELNERAISDVMDEMKDESEDTNEEIAKRIVADTILEYLAENNIQSLKGLKSKEKQDEIYEKLKNKLMSEDSRKTADVIAQINGGQPAEDVDISLSEKSKMRKKILKATSAIELITSRDIEEEAKKTNREEVVERETTRRKLDASKRIKEEIAKKKGRLSKEDLRDDFSDKEIEMLLLLQENEKIRRLEKESKIEVAENRKSINDLINQIGK